MTAVLLYRQRVGQHEDRIIEAALERGDPVPAGILEAPVLRDGLEFYLHAYLELSTCRPVGFGFRPIPWTAIRDYAEAYRVEDLDEFRDIVNLTDDLIRQDIEAREATQAAAAKAGK